MEQPLKVRLLGREYALRVSEDDAELTIEIADYLDKRMRSFRDAHPDQHELTTAVITALAITEELFALKKENEQLAERIDREVSAMNEILAETLRLPIDD